MKVKALIETCYVHKAKKMGQKKVNIELHQKE